MTKEYIRNCSWGYSCDQKWEGLSSTQDTSIRFCDTCQREVHRCETSDILAKNVALNRCVNFSSELIENRPVLQLTGYGQPQRKKAPQQGFNEPSADFDDDIPF